MDYNKTPLAATYLAIAKVIQNDLYLNLEVEQFVSLVMNNCHGVGNPKQIREIFYKLMIELGKVHRND